MTKTILTGIAAAVAMTMTANAEGDDKKGKRAGDKARPDKEAMEKRRAAMKAKLLERFDADEDGKLSEDERKTARETVAKERKAIHEAVIKQFDKNENGKIDEDEREGIREWVKENYPDAIHMGPPRRGGKPGADGRKKGPKGKGGKKDKQPAGEPGDRGNEGDDCPKKGGGCKKKKAE